VSFIIVFGALSFPMYIISHAKLCRHLGIAEWSIVMSMSAGGLCWSASIFPELHVQSSPNFYACYSCPWLNLSSVGGVAIRHILQVSGAARGVKWGEASPLLVDVQKLCNMCVLSLSWNFFVTHDKYIARPSSKEPR